MNKVQAWIVGIVYGILGDIDGKVSYEIINDRKYSKW